MVNTPNGKKIAKVLGNFDFVKAQSIMKDLDWKWVDGCGNEDVPEVWDMVDRAYGLLMRCMSNTTIAACGGLEATYNNGELILKFIAEEAADSNDYDVLNDESVYTPNLETVSRGCGYSELDCKGN